MLIALKLTKKQKILIIAITCFVIAFLIFCLIIQIINHEKIIRGTKISKIEIGGLAQNQAKEKFLASWNDLADEKISLTYQKQNIQTSLNDLGFDLKLDQIIDQAYQQGRTSNIFKNTYQQLAGLITGYTINPITGLNQNEFATTTAKLFKELEKPVKNAGLIFNQKTDRFELDSSQNGIAVNRQKILNDLEPQIKNMDIRSIALDVFIDQPTVENDEIDQAKNQAQKIIDSQPYYLVLDDRTWTINQAKILDWLVFEPIQEIDSDNQILGLLLNEEKITAYLKSITKNINNYPVDAKLEMQDDKVTAFSAGQPGYGVWIEKTVNQLTQNISADEPIRTTTMMAEKIPPKITLDQTNDLGIDTLIGEGVSNFAGSPVNRTHNIKTGAAKFNWMILEPNQEFSFVNLLGGSGPEQGFLPELVIKENKTVPEYGGGLCQVSTTVFRAAVNSGMKITERSAHAFPVAYYNPQGFDATIYEPKPDFRFINNTSHHILIEAFTYGTRLYFNFYGTDDNRQVVIKGPYIYEQKEDGSMKAVLYQEVYKNDRIFEEQTFYSSYKSPDLYPVQTVQEETEEIEQETPSE